MPSGSTAHQLTATRPSITSEIANQWLAPAPISPSPIATVATRMRRHGRWAGPDRASRLALVADLEGRGDGAGAFRVCWPLIAGDPPDAEALAIENRTLAPIAADTDGRGR